MTDYYETMSDGIKSFNWRTLPPGEYKMVGDTPVLLNEVKADYDRAADDFISLLRSAA